MDVFISPHNDDETLFGAYTLMREKPLVVIVTDSWIQPLRGDRGCSAGERWDETSKACEILGCKPVRLGIRDDSLTEEGLIQAFQELVNVERVWAPAIQGGNWQHDLIGKIAKATWKHCVQYTTYTKTELWTKGDIEIIPTEEEKELKLKALNCYTSQINLPSTRPHFQAVVGRSEWILQ